MCAVFKGFSRTPLQSNMQRITWRPQIECQTRQTQFFTSAFFFFLPISHFAKTCSSLQNSQNLKPTVSCIRKHKALLLRLEISFKTKSSYTKEKNIYNFLRKICIYCKYRGKSDRCSFSRKQRPHSLQYLCVRPHVMEWRLFMTMGLLCFHFQHHCSVSMASLARYLHEICILFHIEKYKRYLYISVCVSYGYLYVLFSIILIKFITTKCLSAIYGMVQRNFERALKWFYFFFPLLSLNRIFEEVFVTQQSTPSMWDDALSVRRIAAAGREGREGKQKIGWWQLLVHFWQVFFF